MHWLSLVGGGILPTRRSGLRSSLPSQPHFQRASGLQCLSRVVAYFGAAGLSHDCRAAGAAVPRECKTVAAWIWGNPEVHWGSRGWQWLARFPQGALRVGAGSSPQLRVWEGGCYGGRVLAPASARRRGARCPWVTLRRKGGPRAAPTGPGAGAAWLARREGSGFQSGQKRQSGDLDPGPR